MRLRPSRSKAKTPQDGALSLALPRKEIIFMDENFEPTPKFCPNCGTSLAEDARFCPVCGMQLGDTPAYTPAPAYAPVYAPVVSPYSFKNIYGRAWNVLKQKPIKLWAISLLASFLIGLTYVFGVVPLIIIPVVWVLQLGLTSVLLCGLDGEKPEPEQLFYGFKKGVFGRNVGAMAWKALFLLLWSLIPVAGFVFNIIKGYEYSFVPYLLLRDPELNYSGALDRSKEMTRGLKGRMFWLDVVFFVALGLGWIVLALLSNIPAIGWLFSLVAILYLLAVALFGKLFQGLYRAAVYDERSKEFAE